MLNFEAVTSKGWQSGLFVHVSIKSFESWKWPQVANFKSWTNRSALSFFNFALFHGQKQFLSQIVTFLHETSQKSDASIFMTPGTWKFTKIRSFNFHDPGYMKIGKNQTLQFSRTFMTPGTWNLAKIRRFNFLELSWPRVHETLRKSDASIFSNLTRNLFLAMI